jgi:hypothetical protein
MQRVDRIATTTRHRGTAWFLTLGSILLFNPSIAAQSWVSYGRDSKHDALAHWPSQLPMKIRWQTPVDLAPQYASGGNLYTHYGSPVITTQNTVVVPQKTGAQDGFVVNAFKAATGTQLWTLSTDYQLPAHNWIPPMGITLTPGDGAVAIPGGGGTVLLRVNPNSSRGSVTRLAFFGIRNYNENPGAFDGSLQIFTSITCDGTGNL